MFTGSSLRFSKYHAQFLITPDRSRKKAAICMNKTKAHAQPTNCIVLPNLFCDKSFDLFALHSQPPQIMIYFCVVPDRTDKF